MELHEPLDKLVITSDFKVRVHPTEGYVNFHSGVDFGAAKGTPIYATDNGTVLVATFSGAWGNMIEINHGNGLKTRYCHLNEFKVKFGDSIRKGQIIGTVGDTGTVTGPHLHFEVHIRGMVVDPLVYLGMREYFYKVAGRVGDTECETYRRKDGKVFIEARTSHEQAGSKVNWDEEFEHVAIEPQTKNAVQEIRKICEGVERV